MKINNFKGTRMQNAAKRGRNRAVLALTGRLSIFADQAEASPDLRQIQDAMKANHDRWWVRLWVYPSHRVSVDIDISVLAGEFPEPPVLQVGVDELRRHLSGRDPRFDAEKHLYVRFRDFTNVIRARWVEGKIIVAQ